MQKRCTPTKTRTTHEGMDTLLIIVTKEFDMDTKLWTPIRIRANVCTNKLSQETDSNRHIVEAEVTKAFSPPTDRLQDIIKGQCITKEVACLSMESNPSSA